MSKNCDNCDWESGEDTDGPTMPDYRFAGEAPKRTQVTHCPECQNILETRENNAKAI